MSLKRKIAILEGRAMIRVRYIQNRDLTTVGLCPACWNIKERREALLIQLKKMGLEVVFKDDYLDGVYRPANKHHAPGCRYAKLQPDPWKRFQTALKSRQPKRV